MRGGEGTRRGKMRKGKQNKPWQWIHARSLSTGARLAVVVCFFFSLGAAVSDHSPTPAARKLTFEMSLLRQGEGWRSISSGELAFVCKYRPRPDGGKLATALQPYGAYARGGVCKDPGPGVRAGDGRLLRPRLAQGTRHQRREIT